MNTETERTLADGGTPETATPGSPVDPTPAYPFAPECPFRLPPELARLRREAPVARVRLATGTPAYLVSSYQHVRQVLTDERFSRRPVRARAVDGQLGRPPEGQRGGPPEGRPGGPDAGRPGGPPAGPPRPAAPAFDFGLSVADPADHARWRRHVNQVFNARQAEAMRPRVAQLVENLLDELAGVPQPVDLMEHFAFQLPLRVLCALFEVPDDLRPAFEEWAASLRASGASMAAFGAVMSGLHRAAVELVAARRARPGDGPLSQLIRQPGALSDDDLVSTVLLLAIAGYETVATQLGNGLLALFQHPAELARLRSGEQPSDDAVEEILRYAQASTGFAGMVYATCDVTVADVVIPAGAAVFVSIDSAGRDELRLPDPESFDLSRGSVNSHLAFGVGAHFCLGAPLARVELQESLGRLFARFPDLALATPVADVVMVSNRFNRRPARLDVRLRAD
ncbi:cytochrome P450 family protein [Micromonospora carbonacea]|uniref:Cytochrome P450 n=1 Tax=Micromonospora carbonacea TaxID=47853 RepID=A0A7H8XSH3_9ACTN|nr:cytochrome P450 [Micromonospora carbonacea]MBB5830124.1 cytochrome P450 [Micromonospora carbonacea]QLD27956.1 cytochrome P450 [Micromonospora carbonacea]